MMSFNDTSFYTPYGGLLSDGMGAEEGQCYSSSLKLILKIQSMLQFIFGFVANLCSFAVLIRPRLRRRPTFSYLAFLSLSNALLSLIHSSFTILAAYFDMTVSDLPLFPFCRLLNRFAVDFLTHLSLYTLAAVDLDRISAVTSKTSNAHRNSRAGAGRQHGCARAFLRVCCVELSLASVLFLLNLHWLVFYGYTAFDPSTGTNRTVCTIPDVLNDTTEHPYIVAYSKYLNSVLPYIEIIFFNILPFSVSVVATIVILKQVSVKYTLLSDLNKRLKQSRRRMELHLSILLISLNCVFILFTTPHNIFTVYIGNLYSRLRSKPDTQADLCIISTWQKSFDLLQQCYFMSTFFLYILTNRRFREEFYQLLKGPFCRSCRLESNDSSTQASLGRRHHHHHHLRSHPDETNKQANRLVAPICYHEIRPRVSHRIWLARRRRR